MKSLFKYFLLIILVGCKFANGQNFTEILGRPTDSTITMSILFDQNEDVYWEYGSVSGVYTSFTSTAVAPANTPLEFDFTNLQPDTKYFYRTRYRTSGTSGAFLTGTEHSFHTQRAIGSTFTFTIEADEHLYDKKGIRSEYKICLANQAKDNPDFMISLGDIFGDDHHPTTITSSEMDSLHKDYRPYLGAICHSVPFYICLGNHEGEFDYYLKQTPPNNMAVYGTLWRKFYYPNPYPNNFYTGDTVHEPYGMGQPENYYAWTWGDAMFVVLDAYRYQCDTSAKPQHWDWTLGLPQYTWLKNTLQNSTAQYKFVFIHQLRGQGRGGILDAPYYEWGGKNGNGTDGFSTYRPGWDKPIHQLMVDNGVNILFHGHDHLFSHEVLDGLTYQEVPMPSDSTYEIGMLANADAYASDTIEGSGHLKVVVSPSCVKVDFIRAYLPADTLSGLHHNGEIAFSYTIGNCTSNIENEIKDEEFVKIFPNPATNSLNIQTEFPENYNRQIALINVIGKTILTGELKNGNTSAQLDITDIPSGIYFVKVFDAENSSVFKITVIK
jgi:hypothetical protein